MISILVAAGPVQAGENLPPFPPRVEAPDAIALVGSHAGVPATGFGQFRVIVRDVANNPLLNAQVVIDLSGCADLQICADQLDPSVIVYCPGKTVRKLTDVTGIVTFTVLGGSNGYLLGGPRSLAHAGKIYANGHLGATPSVFAYDLDGTAGVGANDVASWLTDFGSGMPWARSDYDASGSIGANDLSLWLVAFGSWTMSESCVTSCP